jgi:hypothetical protein
MLRVIIPKATNYLPGCKVFSVPVRTAKSGTEYCSEAYCPSKYHKGNALDDSSTGFNIIDCPYLKNDEW